MARSELFQPYRALGYVCDDTPMHLKRLGTENFATVSIGSSWQVYNVSRDLLDQALQVQLRICCESFLTIVRQASTRDGVTPTSGAHSSCM